MTAVDIIEKDKSILNFKGLNKTIHEKKKSIIKQIKALKEKIKYKIQNINQKQHQLVTLTCKVKN